MLRQAEDLANHTDLRADVCVIGAGAAGITLSLTLEKRGFSVLLLEGGGEAQSDESQDVYRGVMAHHYERRAKDYLHYSRLRFLGGTTNHWAGWVRPLDAIDFEARSWVPNSGWPFGPEALAPFYAEAAQILDLKAPFFTTPEERWATAKPATLDLGPGARLRSRPFTFSAPTRFGTKYKKRLVGSKKIEAVLGANVVDLRLRGDGDELDYAVIKTFGGKDLTARARAFVLATGGIENARLLLAAKSQRPAGLGNEHDVVGRYFMDHPETFFEAAGNVVILDAALLGDKARLGRYSFPKLDPVVKGARTLNTLWLTEDVIRREGLLQFHAHLFPAERKAVPALLDEVGAYSQALVAGLGEKPAPEKRPLILRSECTPQPENRVTLTDDRDALGVPRAHLYWKLGELEARTHERGLDILADTLGAVHFGRVQILMRRGVDRAFRRTGMGMHHLGTTRLHDDPKRGVVDKNARVHSVANLYVAGSSLFPTSGGANPTFTIVALALRLGEHLGKELGRGAAPGGKR